MMERMEIVLPASLMKAMDAICDSKDMSPVQKLEAVLLMTHGYGLFVRYDQIDPTMTAIPRKQWGDVAEKLMNLVDDDLGKVNLSLDWMNKGPSSWEDIEVKR